MIYIFIFTVAMLVILTGVYAKKVKYDDIKYDSELSPLVGKLGSNVEITEEILKKLGNNHTKVISNPDEKSTISYYNHKKDEIVMQSSSKNEYMRVVNAAHECVHTTQKKSYLVMNKVFSNIQILYFLFLMIYFFYIESAELKLILSVIQILVLLITLFAKIVIESDACYRSVNVAEEYLADKFGIEKSKKYKTKIEANLYDIIPMYYINFLMQGGIMVILVQIIAMI